MKYKKLTLENGIVCLLSSIFITAAGFLLFAGETVFTDTDIFDIIRNGRYFVILTLLFVVMFFGSSFFEGEKYTKVLLLVSFMVYAVICMSSVTDTFFCFGACLVLLPVCIYVFSYNCEQYLKKDLSKKVLITGCAVFAVCFSLLFGIQTVCRYLTLSTPCFDFGIFSQMFHNMRQTLIPATTCEREMLLSHFAVHVSPIYYLFLPFYAVFPSPITLQICQVVMLASGVIPLVLLTKKLGLSNKSSLIFALLYLLFPALGGGTYYDLHENKFLAPLILFLFYFIEKEHISMSLLFGVLVCLVKEDAPIYVMFAAVYTIFSKKTSRGKFNGAFLLSVSFLYFGVVTMLLNIYGQGVMNYRYSNFMTNGEGTLSTVVINIIKNPAYVIYEMFGIGTGVADISKQTFALQMLLPLGFMPFVTKKIERIILILPFILVNLMPDYVYQHDIYFQYTYGTFPFLLYASVLNYRDLSPKTKRVIAMFALCASILVCTQTVYMRAVYCDRYVSNKKSYDEIRNVLENLPKDASVSASTFFCAALSERSELYSIDNSEQEHKTDYVALDLRYSENDPYYDQYIEDNRYSLTYFKSGYIAVFQKNMD